MERAPNLFYYFTIKIRTKQIVYNYWGLFHNLETGLSISTIQISLDLIVQIKKTLKTPSNVICQLNSTNLNCWLEELPKKKKKKRS